MKGYAKDLRSALGANVIALALDADEPQVFVTADETAVAQGVSAGDLVRLAVGAIDGRGGGRPEMAQGARHAGARARRAAPERRHRRPAGSSARGRFVTTPRPGRPVRA